MMNEEVRKIMTTDPVTVSPHQSITEVSNILMLGRCHHVPVVENKILVGMVTTYDLWKQLEKSGKNQDVKVAEVMTTHPIKITPIDKVGTAAELFLDNRFHALPVVNLRGELKGVVTSYDVLKYTYKKEYTDSVVKPEIFEETVK